MGSLSEFSVRSPIVKPILEGQVVKVHSTQRKKVNFCRQVEIVIKAAGFFRVVFLLSLKKADTKTLIGLLAGHYYHKENRGVVFAICKQSGKREEAVLYFRCSCRSSQSLDEDTLERFSSINNLRTQADVVRFAKACKFHSRRPLLIWRDDQMGLIKSASASSALSSFRQINIAAPNSSVVILISACSNSLIILTIQYFLFLVAILFFHKSLLCPIFRHLQELTYLEDWI